MKLEKNNDNPINEEKIVNQIRGLALDMIQEAKSGHPGIVLSAAPIIYCLYSRFLKINPENPEFYNRDRFVMSAGHGSSLLYATLHMAGYDLELYDLKKFRQINSKTPGHPEYKITPGVDMTTGPLGQGLATAVGVAIGEKHLEENYNKEPEKLIDFYTYVLCGDGDLEEGISYEAMSLAGTLKLNKLIVLYDSNDTSLSSKNVACFTENIEERMKSMNWNYIRVNDGENLEEINHAIELAKSNLLSPTLIEVKTTLGKYSKYEGKNKIHGGVLEEEDLSNIKKKLKLRDIPFNISSDTMEDFQYLIHTRMLGVCEDFYERLEHLDDSLKEELTFLMNEDKTTNSKHIIYEKPEDDKESLRDTSGKVLNSIVKNSNIFLGGSADLFEPTKTYIEGAGDYAANNYKGKNIFFGVREHAMGAILNGISLLGYRSYGSTFLSFSDYLKPSIRMAAMLDLPVTYLFTHDSISIGEDGTTHQPVEQLVSLRATPNLEVFRPCDANEVIGAYKAVLKKKSGPSVISLSKTTLPILSTTSSSGVAKGGYVVRENKRKLDGILIATGEEVHQAIEVANLLEVKGFDVRVVSMPSIERFLEQEEEYIESVIPVGVKKIVIEAASSMSWNRIVYHPKYLITLDSFGSSGKREDVYTKYGFDIASLEEKIENLLK